MGIEKNRVDQESLEQKPVNSIEQQESDPMVGLEKASTELNDSMEKLAEMTKLDYRIESDGSGESMIEALQGEDNEKFSEFKTSLASKYEKLKGILDGIVDVGVMGTLAGAGFVGLFGSGGHFEVVAAAVGVELVAGIVAVMRMYQGYVIKHDYSTRTYESNRWADKVEGSDSAAQALKEMKNSGLEGA